MHFIRELLLRLRSGRSWFAFLLLFFLSPPGYGQQNIKTPVTLSARDKTLREVFKELEQKTGFTINYQDNLINASQKVSIEVREKPLSDVLHQLLNDTKVTFRQQGSMIVLIRKETAPLKAPGKITGRIMDEDNGKPVADATVRIGNTGTTSGIDGTFSLVLPEGRYTAIISYIGYTAKEIREIDIAGNQPFELNVALKRKKGNLAAVEVVANARKESVRSLLLAQKNNAAISDGISAEQIRVTADNNTAQVLKRVSGITVQNEKFVTIRGVSDRYNNVLINGASLPSTEPNRRNFSFDIVPSQLVDNVVVNKTATPDLPGEFTGGLVQITTKDVPSENFLTLAIGSGFNTASINRNMLSYRRDQKAWWGEVDADRKYFGDGRLMDPVQYYKHLGAGDAATIRKIGSQIPNRWQFVSAPYRPSQQYQLAGGLFRRLKKSSIGMVAAGTYHNEQLVEEGESRTNNQYDFVSERYRYNTTIGGLLNLSWKSPAHRISIKNLFNRRYSNQFDNRQGDYISQGWYARRTGEVTLHNRLWENRLEGEHKVTRLGIRLDWHVDHTSLNRDQPDTRFITGTRFEGYPGDMYKYNFNDILLLMGGLYSSLLNETRNTAGANFGLPFTVRKEQQLFKMGYSYSERKADFDAANFRILGDGRYTESMAGLPYYGIVTTEAFANGNLQYYPASTRAVGSLGDKYTGTQLLKAGYAMLDLRPFHKMRVIGGIRYEDNTMELNTIYYDYTTGNPSFDDSTYYEKDWLPSVNLIYSMTDKINFRGAFSKTLARPDFVERSPYIYYDFTELAEVIGQKALKVSRIDNYDFRFEYYPSGDEIISASVFYKKFTDPVERFYNIGTTSNSVEYRNLYEATAKGYEFDIRKSLSFIDPEKKWLKQLKISANYTRLKGEIRYLVTQSPVTLKDTSYVAAQGRPIQGLSPFIINAGINYQSAKWGANIAYNRIGPRIVNGGTNTHLIQYENTRDVLDMQLSLRLFKQKAEMKMNISDILNQPFVIYSNTDISQGTTSAPGPNNDPKGDRYNEKLDLTNYKAKRGTNISFSFTYKLQ